MATRECMACEEEHSREAFSSNQWRKGQGLSRCEYCVDGGCWDEEDFSRGSSEPEAYGNASSEESSEGEWSTCYQCREEKPAVDFTNNQWRKGEGVARCMDCVEDRETRRCAECFERCEPSEYSNNQWNKGDGVSRCFDCATTQSTSKRACGDCGANTERGAYSSTQWRKGDGASRCAECLQGRQWLCPTCGKILRSESDLSTHMTTHLQKNLLCPACGLRSYAQISSAVQHVESGNCRGCRGQEVARNVIYSFVRSTPQGRALLKQPMAIGNGAGGGGAPKPTAYSCNCGREYKNLSQLLAHQRDAHGAGGGLALRLGY
jgi:hypothetical protein